MIILKEYSLSMTKYQELNQRINYLLQLERKIVGITFLNSKEEFVDFPLETTKKMMPYCAAVKKATEGHSFKLTVENFACPASAVALGLVENNNYSASGQKHLDWGVYADKQVSKQVNDEMVYRKKGTYGVAIQPIENWQSDPDVVLIITTPFNAMRLIQGNVYYNGQLKSIKMAGMMALCQEATSYPYETGEMNISMMCSGTRFVARWKDEELCVGIPFKKFETVIAGVEHTVNPMELRHKKEAILEKTAADGNADYYDVKKNENYFRNGYKGVKGKFRGN